MLPSKRMLKCSQDPEFPMDAVSRDLALFEER